MSIPEDRSIRPPPADGDPEALRRYGRELATDSLLRSLYGRKSVAPGPAPAGLRRHAVRPAPTRSRPPSRVRSGPIVATAASVALLVAGAWLFRPVSDSVSADPLRLTVQTITGSGRHYDDDGIVYRSLQVGETILPGALIGTGELDEMGVRLPDGSEIVLGPGTRLRGEAGTAPGDGHLLSLVAGRLTVNAASQPERAPLRFATPHARARVLGTRFTLTVRGSHSELAVDHGLVDFARPDEGGFEVGTGKHAALGPEVAWIQDAPDPMGVTDFTLVSVRTGDPVPHYDPIPEGSVISLATLPPGGVNVRVNTGAQVKWVRIDGAESSRRGESEPPFSVAGDSGQNYFAWKISPRQYAIRVTPMLPGNIPGEATTLTIAFRP